MDILESLPWDVRSRRVSLVKIILVGGCLVSAVSVGLWVSGKIRLGTGALAIAIGGAAIALGGPPLGVILCYALSLLQNWFSLPVPGAPLLTYFGPWMGLGLYLGGTVLLSSGALHRVTRAIRACWGLPYLVAYVVSGLVLAPILYSEPETHIVWTLIVTLAVMCLPMVLTLPKAQVFALTKSLLLLAFGASFLLYSYLAFFYRGNEYVRVLQRQDEQFLKINTVFGGGNDSAGLFVSLLPFALLYLERARVWRWLRWAVVLLGCYFVYRSFTRMAWISLPVTMATYFFCLGKKRYGVAVLIVSIVAAIASPAVGVLFGEIAATGGIAPDAANNLAGRIYLTWSPMMQRTLGSGLSMLFGSGDATWYISSLGAVPVMSHNLWVERFVTRGVLGTGLWLLFTVDVIVRALTALRKLPPDKRGWLAAGIAGWVAYNTYGLSANAFIDHAVLTFVLMGVCMWAYAGMVESQESGVGVVEANRRE